MLKSRNFKLIVVSISSFVLLTTFLVTVDPAGKPLVYILIPILLCWVALFSLFLVAGKLLPIRTGKIWTVGSFIAVSSIMLLVLFSGVGQLNIADLLLVGSLVGVSSFYFYRTWS